MSHCIKRHIPTIGRDVILLFVYYSIYSWSVFTTALRVPIYSKIELKDEATRAIPVISTTVELISRKDVQRIIIPAATIKIGII